MEAGSETQYRQVDGLSSEYLPTPRRVPQWKQMLKMSVTLSSLPQCYSCRPLSLTMILMKEGHNLDLCPWQNNCTPGTVVAWWISAINHLIMSRNLFFSFALIVPTYHLPKMRG